MSLPADIWCLLIAHLDVFDVISVSQANRELRALCEPEFERLLSNLQVTTNPVVLEGVTCRQACIEVIKRVRKARIQSSELQNCLYCNERGIVAIWRKDCLLGIRIGGHLVSIAPQSGYGYAAYYCSPKPYSLSGDFATKRFVQFTNAHALTTDGEVWTINWDGVSSIILKPRVPRIDSAMSIASTSHWCKHDLAVVHRNGHLYVCGARIYPEHQWGFVEPYRYGICAVTRDGFQLMIRPAFHLRTVHPEIWIKSTEPIVRVCGGSRAVFYMTASGTAYMFNVAGRYTGQAHEVFVDCAIVPVVGRGAMDIIIGMQGLKALCKEGDVIRETLFTDRYGYRPRVPKPPSTPICWGRFVRTPLQFASQCLHEK
eukprot:TRINITY_DN809_c1_g1_i7.p1 TRINITY_DN809_c1_g1~~TRINITY_DN809_c1_g1_i7.p1  ORF type:complete len:382 (+),score=8.26 TRINITY_DN809_c1_g1_i7:34-1146(+)